MAARRISKSSSVGEELDEIEFDGLEHRRLDDDSRLDLARRHDGALDDGHLGGHGLLDARLVDGLSSLAWAAQNISCPIVPARCPDAAPA